MILLHDPTVRDAIRGRLERLPATAERRWGRMSAGQMLWHCNQVLRTSLGDIVVESRRPPFPIPVLKFLLFAMPWPPGAPTAPEYQPGPPRDFETEQQQCLALVDRFTARAMDEPGWPPAVFGPITGREWSRLQAKHLDHHLRQFGA